MEDPLAARALAARKYAKLTQRQAEEHSGVRQSDISKIERGETVRPSGLVQLARAYRCDPIWLVTGEGRAPWEEAALPRSADITGERDGPYRVTRVPPPIPFYRPGTPGTVPLIKWEQAATWTGPTIPEPPPPAPPPLPLNVRELRKGMLPPAPPPQPVPAEMWIPCVSRHSELAYALRVRGDSMTAPSGHLKSYPVDAIIFVDPQRVQPMDGERIIARLDASGEVTFKAFKQEDGRRWLQPLNPAHEPIRLAFTVLGTIIGKWEDED